MTTFSRYIKWGSALETDCKDNLPIFLFFFLNGVKISVQVFTLDLLWSLEFGVSPHCNCFTMSPLNCAVTKTQIAYGSLPFLGVLF